MGRETTPEECPVCGEPVPPGAPSCPSCGADERTGWDEEATRLDGIDLPGEDPGPEGGPPVETPRWVRPLSVALLVAFVVGLVLAIR